MDHPQAHIGLTLLDTSQALLLHADWPSVDAYYYGSSSSHSIPNVRIPLLCIQVIAFPASGAVQSPDMQAGSTVSLAEHHYLWPCETVLHDEALSRTICPDSEPLMRSL